MNRKQRRDMQKRQPKSKPVHNEASITASNAQSTLDNLSVMQLAAGANNLLMQLENRGVNICDWDHKTRKLYRLQMIRGKLYFLAADQWEPVEDHDTLILQAYLDQYCRALRRRAQLESRLAGVCEQMKSPIGGINYDPIYKPSGEVGLGSAAFTFRKAEYEERIEEQRQKAAQDILKVMDILDYLDANSDERMVLELRYIDNLEWPEVARRAHMSRSTCFNKHKEGIKKLLSFKRVRQIITNYEPVYEAELEGAEK